MRGWDEELLRIELAALQGEKDEELDSLLEAQDAANGLTDEDAVPELPQTSVSVAGDLWAFGSCRTAVESGASLYACHSSSWQSELQEAHALRGHAIDVRCIEVRTPVARHVSITEIIMKIMFGSFGYVRFFCH